MKGIRQELRRKERQDERQEIRRKKRNRREERMSGCTHKEYIYGGTNCDSKRVRSSKGVRGLEG